jgi:hypothetical protein
VHVRQGLYTPKSFSKEKKNDVDRRKKKKLMYFKSSQKKKPCDRSSSYVPSTTGLPHEHVFLMYMISLSQASGISIIVKVTCFDNSHI